MYYNNYLQTCSFKLNFELGDHIFESLLQILTKIFCQTLNLKIHKKVKNIPIQMPKVMKSMSILHKNSVKFRQ